MTAQDYPQIGSGWAFPVRWTDDAGVVGVVRSDGERKVQESMHVILKTGLGERVMRPTFGAGAYDFVFEPRNDQTLHQVGFDTERALRLWEPRVIVDDVTVEPAGADDRIDVEITYRIDRHRRPSSLVLPFYRMGEPGPGTRGENDG